MRKYDLHWTGTLAELISIIGPIGGKPMKPTYEELVTLLREAPPRQMITDQRYWDWRKRVEEALSRLDG